MSRQREPVGPAAGAPAWALTSEHRLVSDATLQSARFSHGSLWPFSLERFFAPWRPIPVAPIGFGFLSARGMRVAGVELVAFAPLFVYALWPRRSP
jgi:inner membrane protein